MNNRTYPLEHSNLILELKSIYTSKKDEIIERLKEFEQKGKYGNDEEIFAELCFCILTPQSRAEFCWDSIKKMKGSGLLLKGDIGQIEKEIYKVRFKKKKAKYIVEARKFFTINKNIHIKNVVSKFNNINECRNWLVENITGIGYKEASHFLRNIGLGEKFAILDRHILKNLKELKIIKEIPKSISKSKYIDIENAMIDFSTQIGIPLSHLDLLFWYRKTGEIFK